MKYNIFITKYAQKFIKKQPCNQQKRILNKISELPSGDIKHLTGYESIFRLRIGNYRVIYEINNENLTIKVIAIGNRGYIYKDFEQ